jgi:hypothetical protein
MGEVHRRQQMGETEMKIRVTERNLHLSRMASFCSPKFRPLALGGYGRAECNVMPRPPAGLNEKVGGAGSCRN